MDSSPGLSAYRNMCARARSSSSVAFGEPSRASVNSAPAGSRSRVTRPSAISRRASSTSPGACFRSAERKQAPGEVEDALREIADGRVTRERDPAGAELTEARDGSPNATDEELRALAHMFRYALSPGDESIYAQMNLQVNVRHVLPAIAVPTLVLQNADDHWAPIAEGRELAGLIPGATYVEVPVRGHLPPAAHRGGFLEPIESFLREAWEEQAAGREPERVLATVLFTDIVDSTTRMAEVGDRAWRELLERHHAIVRTQLTRGRGSEVDTAGDGF